MQNRLTWLAMVLALAACGAESGGAIAQAVKGPSVTVTARPDPRQLAVSWTADPAATSYQVFQSANGGTFALAASVFDSSGGPPSTSWIADGGIGGNGAGGLSLGRGVSLGVAPPGGQLVGGCPGGAGGGDAAAPGGVPGQGGGAVYLLSEASIAVTGAILARGGGGADGLPEVDSGSSGGGGGGSGGTIVLEARQLALSGALDVGGGTGGRGADAARLDVMGVLGGGMGGAGATATAAAGQGQDGAGVGGSGSGLPGGGGGGGGGSLGVVASLAVQ